METVDEPLHAPAPHPSTDELNELPARPSYTWQPSEQLYQYAPTLKCNIFESTLTDDDKRAIIDRYLAVEGIKYTPPATLPEAAKKFSRGQQREDNNLRNIQYVASGILRPLDVMAHAVAQQNHEATPRLMAIINDTRLLVLHACGTANQARNEVALRAVRPSCSVNTTTGTQYTMQPSEFHETLSQHMAIQRTLRTAQPRRPTPQQQQSAPFFGDRPPVEPQRVYQAERARPRTNNFKQRRPPTTTRHQQQ